MKNMVHIIMDNKGNYPYYLGLDKKDTGDSTFNWEYVSFSRPSKVDVNFDFAKIKIAKFKELATLAGFNDLDWSIITIAENDWLKMCRTNKIFIESRDITKGTKTKLLKKQKEIYNKYKLIVKEAVEEYMKLKAV